MANDPVDEYNLPTTVPPSDTNIALARRLCQKYLGGRGAKIDDGGVSAPSLGWSKNALIQVKSTHGKWIVKVPRVLSAESIAACKSEGERAQWAGGHGVGPPVVLLDDQTGSFIMPLLDASPLTNDEIVQRLDEVTELLSRLHKQSSPSCFKPFSIFDLTRKEMALAKANSTVTAEELSVVRRVLQRAESIVATDQQLAPCHNDFLNTNILSDKNGKLWCIDYEYAGVGDPLWDVGYLAVELDTDPRNVARAYGLKSDHDQLKVVAYCNVAKVYSAVWCSNRVDGWHDLLPGYLAQIRIADQEQDW